MHLCIWAFKSKSTGDKARLVVGLGVVDVVVHVIDVVGILASLPLKA